MEPPAPRTLQPTTQPPDLTVVVVSFNVAGLLRRCLTSLAASTWQTTDLALPPSRYPAIPLSPHSHTLTPSHPQTPAEVIVVDNASTDGSAELVRREFPWVVLIANAANVGFTAANNQALRQARGRHVLLLNPDAEVERGALRALVEYLDRHSDVGAVGPQLRFPDGRVQSSRRRFPTLLTGILESTVWQRWFPNASPLRAFYVADRSDDEIQDVDWLVGAGLMVRHEVISRVGLLDEGFFMYSEELDWCWRIKTAGWRVVYVPVDELRDRAPVVVLHHEAQSSRQNNLARHAHFQRSKVRYFAKHHGRLAAFLVRLSIGLSYLVQLAEETVKYALVPTKRSERRSYLGVLARLTLQHLAP